jgi:hypothetical protein
MQPQPEFKTQTNGELVSLVRTDTMRDRGAKAFKKLMFYDERKAWSCGMKNQILVGALPFASVRLPRCGMLP